MSKLINEYLTGNFIKCQDIKITRRVGKMFMASLGKLIKAVIKFSSDGFN